MRRAGAFAGVIALAASAANAQPDATIRVDVQQVIVPVIVTDRNGHNVTGLRESDFHVFEDGVEQKIAAFSNGAAGSLNDIGALEKAPAAAAGPRRTYVICVDALHTGPASAARLREALEKLFEGSKPADAQYVLIAIGRQLQVLTPATANPLAILVKLRSPGFQASLGGYDGSAFEAQLNSLRSRMDEFCRRCSCSARQGQSSCDTAVDVLKQSVDADAERWSGLTAGLLAQFRSVVEELGKLPTGRTLILASDGFDTDPRREFYRVVSGYLPGRPQFQAAEGGAGDTAIRDALRIAEERNIRIDAIDTRASGTAPTFASASPMDAGGSPGGGGSNVSVLGTNRNAGANAGVRSATLGSLPIQSAPVAQQTSRSMTEVAAMTGGLYLRGSDVLKNLRGALADGREYYVLAYVPRNAARDAGFRRLTVELTDKKLMTRAKSGYWAPGTGQ